MQTLDSALWQAISDEINQVIAGNNHQPFVIEHHQSVAGGDINQAFRLSGAGQTYFVKINAAHLRDMFEAEQLGLECLASSLSIRVPRPLVVGQAGENSFLVLENLQFGGTMPAVLFGEQMAALHQTTNKQFGFSIDNTIGSTPQINTWQDSWVTFWQQQRLGYQLDLVKNKGFKNLFDIGLQLNECLPPFFENYQPLASLLHGDLWSGNYAADEKGQPVIFDPACYFGDHEADLAMMELFGHPGQDFFAAYENSYPIDAGYATRKHLYNLYHILNHVNLFGAAYESQAKQMMQKLLSEAR